MTGQWGFADVLLDPRAGQNDRLARIADLIDWAAFTDHLPPASKPGPGRPSYPPISMFKALLLAQWYILSDPALEEALSDRLSFRRFCGFSLSERTPDETTFCRFRLALGQEGRSDRLMAELSRQLDQRHLILRAGTMIDATLIEAQGARPSRPEKAEAEKSQSEKAQSEKTEPEKSTAETTTTADSADAPAVVEKPPHRPSDPDARFAKKGGKTVYGYKAHVAVDLGSGLIRKAILTAANVHDTTPADDLILGDETAVFADKAYSTHARTALLKAKNIRNQIMHRPNKHHPKLPLWKRIHNRAISKRRCAIERTFGIWKRQYGYTCTRYFSHAANAIELQLKCMAFNLRRMEVLVAR